MSPAILALVIAAADSASFIRVNRVGYLASAPKVAVLCALDSSVATSFRVLDDRGRVVLGPRCITNARAVASRTRRV